MGNMAKFATMEIVLEQALKLYGKSKSELTSTEAPVFNLGSGLIAGFAAATISQPADTLLSKEIGVRGLFTGLKTRLVMVGTLTALQFSIYGEIKKALGATNSVEISK